MRVGKREVRVTRTSGLCVHSKETDPLRISPVMWELAKCPETKTVVAVRGGIVA